ncbi:MAG: energy transducer TonB [Flavobacteriaceae bacterium]|nr:energy transducer TonB [Flavobacteriaceae bacterium]
MNFSKTPKKQHQTEKFQKSPFIFTQLGLILALLLVYSAFEFTTKREITMLEEVAPYDDSIFVTSDSPVVIIEKKEVKKELKIKRKLPLIDPIIVPDDTDIVEKVLDPPIDNDPPIDIINTIIEVPSGDDDGDILPFRVIEEAPIFPGCEGLDSLASRQCFIKKISKFVNKKFDASLAEGLNIVGKQRISVQFTIDKTGTVTNIKARAPHKSLEKEAIRVVRKLPQMTPGKQRKRPVGVKYTLPIVFFIE